MLAAGKTRNAEGFGFPVLEAMSKGCRVLTSNTSPLPEVAGNAVHFVDPPNIQSIVQGMLHLIEDANLGRELAPEGPQQAARFTWKTCAEKTLSIYSSLM